MKNMIFAICVFLLPISPSYAQIANHESKGNLEAANPLSCVSYESIKPSNSAADITAGAKKCAKKSKYESAAQLIMVASAFAFFDTQRVADKTAHGALNALFAQEFGSLSEKKARKLFESIDKLDQNEEKKQEICKFLAEAKPPEYMPTYMIAHGMGSFTGAAKNPLLKGFSPKKSWAKSMEFVKCGG